MELDRERVLKLVIVILATLAALAVMSTLVQLVQTILPFLIVGGGIFAGYRWALGDTPAPTADEVQEQARGMLSRFRRTKEAVETSKKVSDALGDLTGAASKKSKPDKAKRVVEGEAKAKAEDAEAAPDRDDKKEREKKPGEAQAPPDKQPPGAFEFSDSDVVISADDVVKPDTSRLEEKAKEVPKVTNNVLAQIEERRRRLEGSD